jgi:NSS family neurotransmitter:Na+ symporter
METVVSIFMDKLKLSRKLSCLTVFGICLLLGIPSALGYSTWSGVSILGMQILDFFDFTSNSIFMPIAAFFTCVIVGYIIGPKTVIDEIELCGNKFRQKALFTVMIRFVAPIFILLILGSSILSALGIISI